MTDQSIAMPQDLPAQDSAQASPAKPSPFATLKHRFTEALGDLIDRTKGSPKAMLIVAAVGGLLLGWFVFGWLLFPVRWTNTDPWDMRGDRQKTYLVMLADTYWHNQDLRFAQYAVEGWDQENLIALLTEISNDSNLSPAARQQVAALADALSLPVYERSLLSSLAEQKGLILVLLLSMLPIAAAIALVPRLLRQSGMTEEDEEALLTEEWQNAGEEDDLEANLLADLEDDLEEEDEDYYDDEDEEEEDDGLILSEEAAEEMANEINDMLGGLFDEEDDSLEGLAAMAKNLADIDINDLNQLSTTISQAMALGLMRRQ